MAGDQKTQVGFRGPSSIPIHKNTIPFTTKNNHSYFPNQLQFNMQIPYSINSLASNFSKPCPLVIAKVPPVTSTSPCVSCIHEASSPASSISSNRLHFAVQLAKMDAKKIKEHREREMEECENEEVSPTNVPQSKNALRITQAYGVRKLQDSRRHPNSHHDKIHQHKIVPNKGKKDVKRNGYHFNVDSKPDHSVDKQTREIRRLEKQMHQYLEKLDELINKGQEVIQKKDRRFCKKDDVSHLSDDDTDPRQFTRADEQATRSARVLYMIERQIRELDDELCKKGRNIRHGKKSQTMNRLAAAQRATVRALQMLINSAPLQPKGSHHYPLMYQELTSLIQQLSFLSLQLESDSGVISHDTKPQIGDHVVSRPSYQTRRTASKVQERRDEVRFKKQTAFNHESTQHEPSLKNISSVTEIIHPDESALTIDPTPERNATLKAGVEALLRAKQHEHEQKPVNIVSSAPAIIKKSKAVLLPSSLQAKRRKANVAVQRRVPVEAAHFTKETTASRLKKVDTCKQKVPAKHNPIKEDEKGVKNEEIKSVGTSPGIGPEKMTRFNDELQEKEIQRQVWLEDETKRKLRDVMQIPQQLVLEAEEAIKMKLQPLLDQAQVVVDSSKSKPIQERFVDLASKVTMKESEALSDMILDDLLIDTVEEFQKLDANDTAEIQAAGLQDSSTLENILQRLEQFEKEEESIRRHLTHVTYDDPRQSKLRYHEEKDPLEMKYIKEGRREPCPIVIESTSLSNKQQLPQDKRATHLPRFNSTKGEMAYSSTQLTRLNSGSTHDRPTYPPTRPLEKSPVPLFLPSKIRENIFSYRQKYSDYLKESNTQHHGTFDPWKVVETLSDDIFDGVIQEVADEFSGACDDVTELIFQSEFTKE